MIPEQILYLTLTKFDDLSLTGPMMPNFLQVDISVRKLGEISFKEISRSNRTKKNQEKLPSFSSCKFGSISTSSILMRLLSLTAIVTFVSSPLKLFSVKSSKLEFGILFCSVSKAGISNVSSFPVPTLSKAEATSSFHLPLSPYLLLCLWFWTDDIACDISGFQLVCLWVFLAWLYFSLSE